MRLLHLLSPFTVIASIRSKEEWEEAVQRGVRHIFLVRSTLSEVKFYTEAARAENIRLYVYFDMIKGLSQDREAVQYLVKEADPDGIVSNKAHIVNESMQLGKHGIFTLFMLDSHSLRLGGKLIRDLNPDAVNIAPGNMPEVIRDLAEQFDTPIIASGLIRTHANVKALYEAGCSAVSTSSRELWTLPHSQLEQGASE